MTNPTNPGYTNTERGDISTTAAILHGDEPQAPNPPPAMITIIPGHIFQAQFIQAGTVFNSNNGNTITFGAPFHNATITAADDGSLNLQILGVNPQLFEAEGVE